MKSITNFFDKNISQLKHSWVLGRNNHMSASVLGPSFFPFFDLSFNLPHLLLLRYLLACVFGLQRTIPVTFAILAKFADYRTFFIFLLKVAP